MSTEPLTGLFPACSSAKNGRTTTVLLSMLKEEIVNTPDKVRKKREGEFRLPDGFHADESGAICCAHGEMKLLTVNRQCGMCPNPCSKAKTGRTLQTPIGYPNHTGPVDSDSSEAQEQEPDAGPAHTASEPGMNPPVSDAALNQDAALPEDSTVEAASGVNPPVLEGHAPDSAELNQHAVLPENSAAVFNPVTKLVVENGDTSNKDTSHKKLLEWDPRFNKEGKAICPLGIPLKSDGTNPKCQTAMFLCPRMTTDANGNVVNTCPNPCEAAKGEHIAIPLAVNRRFLNSTPRDSDEWKEIYKDRIASERVNKRIKCDLHLEAGRHRSGSKWYGRLYLIMILLHAMAWPDPVTAKTP